MNPCMHKNGAREPGRTLLQSIVCMIHMRFLTFGGSFCGGLTFSPQNFWTDHVGIDREGNRTK